MAMDAAAQPSEATPSSDLTIDKFIEGPITCLRFQGTINEAFDGKRLAATVKASTLILDMGRIKKISSFGIREWNDFIRAVERGVDRIIAIECTPKVVDQLNMVAEFLGTKGRVFSFYAPYRCDYCDVDRRVLFQVDRDQQAIRGMRPPEQLCESCSRPEYFDEEPASYFSYFSGQPAFELDPTISEFLSSKLSYSVSGGDRRLHVDKHIEGQSTYLKFVGNLDGSFPSSKIAEGLEGTIVVDVSGVGTIDLAGAAEWRNFITQTKGAAERVLLLGCPPVMLERLTRQGDLGDQVISFTMPYSCSKCATTASQTVEVEQHHDILKFATPPEMKCAHCKSPTVCVAPENLLSRLRTLPRVEIDPGLRKFIKEMRDRKPERPQPVKKPVAASGARLGMFTGLIVVALLAAGTLVAVIWYQQNKKLEKVIDKADNTPTQPAAQRPPWITSDTPLSSYCVDNLNRLSCVGVSSFMASREAARLEAQSAALEEVVNSLALRIDDKSFGEHVRPVYGPARKDALAALEESRADPESDQYTRAVEVVRAARKGVAEALSATGGMAAPTQQAAWYWEEYPAQQGKKGTEFLVFVRFDMNLDAVHALVSEYTSSADVMGSKVVTMFPGLVWAWPEARKGALVLSAGGALESLGVKAGDVVTAVADKPVRTSAELVSALKGKDTHGLKLTVLTGVDGTTKELPAH